MIEKLKSTFFEETSIKLKNSSFLNMFDLLKDSKTNDKFLNIWKNFSAIKNFSKLNVFDIYTVKDEDWWDQISFNVYGTPYFWWVIAALNDIENPFETLEPGQKLMIVKVDYIPTIMKDIKRIREL